MQKLFLKKLKLPQLKFSLSLQREVAEVDHRQPACLLRRLRMQKLFLKNLKLLQLKFGPSHELASNTVHRPAVQLSR
jgi:hypothetical protein